MATLERQPVELKDNDVIAPIYDKPAHFVSGLISFVLCVGFVAVMAKVGALVLNATMGIPIGIGVALVTGVGVLYSFTGGIESVIATDALQFPIFSIAIPILLLSTALGVKGPLSSWDAEAWSRMTTTMSEIGPLQLFGLFVPFPQ